MVGCRRSACDRGTPVEDAPWTRKAKNMAEILSNPRRRHLTCATSLVFDDALCFNYLWCHPSSSVFIRLRNHPLMLLFCGVIAA
jgi:hypothetical protein